MRRVEVSSAHRDLLQSKRMMRRVVFIDVPSTVNQQVVFRQIVLRKSRAPLRSVKFEKLVIERFFQALYGRRGTVRGAVLLDLEPNEAVRRSTSVANRPQILPHGRMSGELRLIKAAVDALRVRQPRLINCRRALVEFAPQRRFVLLWNPQSPERFD